MKMMIIQPLNGFPFMSKIVSLAVQQPIVPNRNLAQKPKAYLLTLTWNQARFLPPHPSQNSREEEVESFTFWKSPRFFPIEPNG